MSANTAGEEHLPKPGEVLNGKYKIEKIIGKGGMGAVLSAHHELLGERIAIKFLLGEIAQNPEAVARFNNEAKNAFKIQSEHVCRIMDVGSERGMPFMVMEFLNGEDLSQMLEKRGALPVEDAVDYVLQALEAIAQAHAFGIVHRDLKPANLFLHRRQDGSAIIKVLDFGIAKANTLGDAGGNHNLTSTKSMLGSPLYMSPEQLRSAKNVDARADIWALGVILYELLTGTVPFNGETLGELFIAILEQPPPPVSHKRPDVPQILSDAIMRCLQRQIDLRFSNVAELAQAVASCAPARSFSSVERVTQALGLPKPNLVQPMPGSMPDARGAMPSYAGNPNTPNPYTSSQSGPRPAQFSSSNSGVHQFSPQGGTQMLGQGQGGQLGSQTGNAAWGNTAGGQVPTSKAPLIAGLAIVGLVAIGAIGGGVYYATHKTAATAPTAAATDTAKTADTSTVATSTATTTSTSTAATSATTTSTATTTTADTTAPTATHTAIAMGTHTGNHTQPTATAQTTATAAPTAHPTATSTAFDPTKLERRP
jgi:serine/threonine-protein kinase